jgi:hypothetical protein
MTALLRAGRWANATCLMYEKENFLGWTAAFRGLLESAGDTLDGLYRIPDPLARYHRQTEGFLKGNSDTILNVSELEMMLGHFVHAKWMRTKRNEDNVLKAKDNVDYVRNLSGSIDIDCLYRQLCSIFYPSSASIEYFYEINSGDGFKLSARKDAQAIAALVTEYPDALSKAIQAHCVPPFLRLRVLHKFRIHPQIEALKTIDWKRIEMAKDTEPLLRG